METDNSRALSFEERANKIYAEFHEEKSRVDSSISGIRKALEASTREISKIMEPPSVPKLPEKLK